MFFFLITFKFVILKQFNRIYNTNEIVTDYIIWNGCSVIDECLWCNRAGEFAIGEMEKLSAQGRLTSHQMANRKLATSDRERGRFAKPCDVDSTSNMYESIDEDQYGEGKCNNSINVKLIQLPCRWLTDSLTIKYSKRKLPAINEQKEAWLISFLLWPVKWMWRIWLKTFTRSLRCLQSFTIMFNQ